MRVAGGKCAVALARVAWMDASLVDRFPAVWVVTSCRTADAWRSCCHRTGGASVAPVVATRGCHGRLGAMPAPQLVLIYPRAMGHRANYWWGRGGCARAALA